MLLQKGSTSLFLGGCKQFSNIVFSYSYIEEGFLTINFFTTATYSELVLLMFYMTTADTELCCFKRNSCKHDTAVSSEYGRFGKSEAAVWHLV
jgi:hypothetical protein